MLTRSACVLGAACVLSACDQNGSTKPDATVADAAPRIDVKAGPRPDAVAVLTQHNDTGRTGANASETCLNPSNVASLSKIATLTVNGLMFAQPLILAGRQRLAIVATMQNELTAFDLTTLSTTPVWKLGQETFGVPGVANPGPGLIGILSTPVIDPATNLLYLIARSCGSSTTVSPCPQTLHVVNALTGAHVDSVVVAGTFHDADGGTHAFTADTQTNRPGLLLQNGRLIAAWGVMTALPNQRHEGNVNYHGTVMAFDIAHLQAPPIVYVATPNGFGAGIWQAGAGLAGDGQFVYFNTGNSTLGPDAAPTTPTAFPSTPRDQENSVVRLLLGDGSVKVASYFDGRGYHTDGNVFQYTNFYDYDMSSSGVALIPGTSALVTGSKGGIVYLLDTNTMTQLQEPLSPFNQIPLPADQTLHIAGDDDGPEVLGAPVVWRTDSNNDALIYMWPRSQKLTSFKFTSSSNTMTQVAATDAAGPSGGMLSLSSNGTSAESAVLWATTPAGNGVGGDASLILAYDPLKLTKLWSASVTGYAKFASPTIAAGRVYVPSWTGAANTTTATSDLLVFGSKACGN